MNRLILGCLLILLSGCAKPANDTVYQYAAIGAFMQGAYDGDIKVVNILQKGDFGLGTFNGIDGEMMVLDGKCYQIRSDGRAYLDSTWSLSPFAMVKFFKADQNIILDKSMSMEELYRFLDQALGTKNLFFAIRIEGEFELVKTRSIGPQVKPYRPFTEVVKEQNVFKLENVFGVMAGFFSPDYFPQLTPAKYHFHFLTLDKNAGGHVLDFRIKKGVIYIDRAGGLDLVFPQNDDYLKRDLSVNGATYK